MFLCIALLSAETLFVSSQYFVPFHAVMLVTLYTGIVPQRILEEAQENQRKARKKALADMLARRRQKKMKAAIAASESFENQQKVLPIPEPLSEMFISVFFVIFKARVFYTFMSNRFNLLFRVLVG